MNTKTINQLATLPFSQELNLYLPAQSLFQGSDTYKVSINEILSSISISHGSLSGLNDNPTYMHITSSNLNKISSMWSLSDSTIPKITSGSPVDSGIRINGSVAGKYAYIRTADSHNDGGGGLYMGDDQTYISDRPSSTSITLKPGWFLSTIDGNSLISASSLGSYGSMVLYNAKTENKILGSENGIFSIYNQSGYSRLAISNNMTSISSSMGDVTVGDTYARVAFETHNGLSVFSSTLNLSSRGETVFESTPTKLSIGSGIAGYPDKFISMEADESIFSHSNEGYVKFNSLGAEIKGAENCHMLAGNTASELRSGNSYISLSDTLGSSIRSGNQILISSTSGANSSSFYSNQGNAAIDSTSTISITSELTSISGSEGVYSVEIGNDSLSVLIGQFSNGIVIGESSNMINVGENSTESHFGSLSGTVSVGDNASTAITVGRFCPDITIGGFTVGPNGSLKIGELTSSIDIGTSAGSVSVGSNSEDLNLGLNAGSIFVGAQLTENIPQVLNVFVEMEDGSMKKMNKAEFIEWLGI